ncbi:expressed unknown protein [Seminavis robusta]|uniref:Uncharacterized protein n=1 Tax=Seminavis robusta TaxID=568900 RepID=A0A9N8HW32_9STRA|nr:expressed unknown protein [Seminavis robusta]|eukprot:Sro2119_g315340.1 n/a (193) ;mRNA; f:5296-5874
MSNTPTIATNTTPRPAAAADEGVRVSFNENPSLLLIPPVQDYTTSEVEQLWYTPDDHEEIMEDAMDVANGWNYEGDSTRGTEKLNRITGKQSEQRRKHIVRAVLQEQHRLRSSGQEPRLSLLAKVATPISTEDQSTAYERAYNDELESLPRKTSQAKSNNEVVVVKKGFMSSVSRMFGVGGDSRNCSPPRML